MIKEWFLAYTLMCGAAGEIMITGQDNGMEELGRNSSSYGRRHQGKRRYNNSDMGSRRYLDDKREWEDLKKGKKKLTRTKAFRRFDILTV